MSKTGLLLGARNVTVSLMSTERSPFYLEKTMKKLCLNCEKEFDVFPYQIKSGRGKYCSVACYQKKRYTHIIKEPRGYVLVYKPTHPRAKSNGYIYQHTHIMEIKLGRFLKKQECVHHKDHNVANNEPENLVLTTRGEHKSKYHPDIGKNHRFTRESMLRFWKKQRENRHETNLKKKIKIMSKYQKAGAKKTTN